MRADLSGIIIKWKKKCTIEMMNYRKICAYHDYKLKMDLAIVDWSHEAIQVKLFPIKANSFSIIFQTISLWRGWFPHEYCYWTQILGSPLNKRQSVEYLYSGSLCIKKFETVLQCRKSCSSFFGLQGVWIIPSFCLREWWLILKGNVKSYKFLYTVPEELDLKEEIFFCNTTPSHISIKK